MWLFLLLVPSAVLSAAVDLCEPGRNAGVNMTTYAKDVAHSLHSLSVEDIRYFFDEQFPISNTIPTVNLNLTGSPVLSFAPSRPSAFKFPAGAIVDFVLSNNDQTRTFGLAGETHLEEIVHYMHMLEMWNMASKSIRRLFTDVSGKNNMKSEWQTSTMKLPTGILDIIDSGAKAIAFFLAGVDVVELDVVVETFLAEGHGFVDLHRFRELSV